MANSSQVNLKGETALMLAASKGNSAIVRALLRAKGIDLSVRDEEGKTAVERAAEKGHEES